MLNMPVLARYTVRSLVAATLLMRYAINQIIETSHIEKTIGHAEVLDSSMNSPGKLRNLSRGQSEYFDKFNIEPEEYMISEERE